MSVIFGCMATIRHHVDIVIDKQWIDEDKNPIELTLNTALYGVGTQTDQFGPAIRRNWSARD